VIPETVVDVRWEVLGDVRPEPEYLLLGETPVGTPLLGRVVLTSQAGRPFRIQRCSVHPPESGTVVTWSPSNPVVEVELAPPENATAVREIFVEVVTNGTVEFFSIFAYAVGSLPSGGQP
jgi:hypothetical protein